MPPPKKRNAFYYFMVAKKKKLEAQGVAFPGGLTEVSNFVGKEWENMTWEERKAYDRDQKMKPNTNSILSKLTTSAEKPLWKYQSKIELKQAIDAEISKLAQNENVEDMKFILIDFNVWYPVTKKSPPVPSEIGMLAFSLKEGVIDCYGTIIDPRNVEVRMWTEVLKTVDDLQLPLPPFDYSLDATNIKYIINCILWFTYKHRDDLSPGHLFCRRGSTKIVNGCLQWLCKEAGENTLKFSVCPFDDLMVKLVESREVKNSILQGNSPNCISASTSGYETSSPPDNSLEKDPRGVTTTEHPEISAVVKKTNVVSRAIQKNQNIQTHHKSTEDEIPQETKSEIGNARIFPVPKVEPGRSRNCFTDNERSSLTTEKECKSCVVAITNSTFTPCKQEVNMITQNLQTGKVLHSDEISSLPQDNKKTFNTTLSDGCRKPLTKVVTVLESAALYEKWQFACFYHELNNDVCYKCSLSTVHRYAFNALRYLLPKFGIMSQSGIHYPTEELAKLEWFIHEMMLKSWGLRERNGTYPLYLRKGNFKTWESRSWALKEARSYYMYQRGVKELWNPKMLTPAENHLRLQGRVPIKRKKTNQTPENC